VKSTLMGINSAVDPMLCSIPSDRLSQRSHKKPTHPVSQCTTCRSCDRDTERQDNETNGGALNKDEDDCSSLQ
jgi:hypothetical protein